MLLCINKALTVLKHVTFCRTRYPSAALTKRKRIRHFQSLVCLCHSIQITFNDTARFFFHVWRGSWHDRGTRAKRCFNASSERVCAPILSPIRVSLFFASSLRSLAAGVYVGGDHCSDGGGGKANNFFVAFFFFSSFRFSFSFQCSHCRSYSHSNGVSQMFHRQKKESERQLSNEETWWIKWNSFFFLASYHASHSLEFVEVSPLFVCFRNELWEQCSLPTWQPSPALAA